MIIPMAGAVPRVVAVLRDGAAAVLPMPSPLPYGVVATSAAAVNEAKGRPAGQPLGVVVDDFAAAIPYFGVERAVAEMVAWMCTERGLNVFVPVGDAAPAWMRQGGATGATVGVMGAWLPGLRGVLDALGPLFVSSANRTTRAVATTAPEADAAFGGRLLVVDGDPVRTTGVPHGSATIVGVSAAGELSVARHGVNDAGYPDGAFLAELRDDYRAAAP